MKLPSIERVAGVAALILIVCVLFDIAAGQDKPGALHDISVVAFLTAALAAMTLVACATGALVRRARGRARKP